MSLSEPLQSLREGGKRAMAEALARLESAPDAEATLALLDAAQADPCARVLGVTGPPGVGKSTLLRALIAACRGRGETVGVIAVDPSSRRSGGALLGDRVRLLADPEDQGLFVRSMAARDRLGGLAEIAVAAMVLMRAVYDRVLVETVGVGQSETDIAGAADTVLFCVQPGSGDSLQFMKAGIVEIPDVIAVTKSDQGAPAKRALADVKGALGLASGGDGSSKEAWRVPVLAVSSERGDGIEELVEAIQAHGDWLAAEGRLQRQRQAQAEGWLRASLRDRYGSHGLERLGPVALAAGESPFGRLAAVKRTMEG